MKHSYAEIDHIINAWAERHELPMYSHSANGEVRCAYVSSIAGECFQIWVDPPASGQVCISAAGVEGRREDDPPQQWIGSVAELDENMEAAYRLVLDWMAPSERVLL